MNWKRFICLAIILFTVACIAAAADSTPNAAQPEFRAIWVDGFHAGVRTPEEATQLVADAKKGNFNALFVQVRRRGDSYYAKSIEPPVEDPPYDGTFDALAYIIDLAHKQGIEVHAWMNAMPIWRNAPPPKDPRHAFNQHGPTATGRDLWLTSAPDGNVLFPVGYFLDPGHPDAAAYLAEVYTSVVRNYPGLDGIHFDYIRYPETEGNNGPQHGSPVGYNAVSLERFRRATGRTDTPAPDDQQFIEWRRQQVTQLVRRVYLQAKEINPHIRVSASVIPWGRAPQNEKDFVNVAPMQRIFQNWVGWLKEGILDTAVPMNYARETDPVVRGYFNGWIRFEKRNKYGRQVVVGIGGYRNTPADVAGQIRRTRIKDGKYAADGVSIFSYSSLSRHERPAAPAPAVVAAAAPLPAAAPVAPVVATQPAAPAAQAAPGSVATPIPTAVPAASTVLVSTPPASAVAPSPASTGAQAQTPPPPPSEQVSAYTGTSGPFAQPAPVPHAAWLDNPDFGWVAGTVRGSDSKPIDGVVVELRSGGFPLFKKTQRVIADGNGFFGFSKVKPGRYYARLAQSSVQVKQAVVAGKVTRVELVR